MVLLEIMNDRRAEFKSIDDSETKTVYYLFHGILNGKIAKTIFIIKAYRNYEQGA
ncbi:MAG: hypothetical protein ACLR56_05620 [Oscillospiraceae bacterium]